MFDYAVVSGKAQGTKNVVTQSKIYELLREYKQFCDNNQALALDDITKYIKDRKTITRIKVYFFLRQSVTDAYNDSLIYPGSWYDQSTLLLFIKTTL